MAEAVNIASRLRAVAGELPDKAAIAEPLKVHADGRADWRTVSYRALVDRVRALAGGFRAIGIGPGCKTLVMLRPGCDFHATTFAL